MTLSFLQPQRDRDTEQRVILHNISWQQYESLLATLEDQPGLRLIYLEGTLEFFMPSPAHEKTKKVIARLIERYSEEVDIPLHAVGSATFRLQAKERGIEPDECYCVERLKEFPDFAIEVNLTGGGVNKLTVYQGLGVPEVLIWQNNQLTLYDLRQSDYQEAQRSRFFPGLDLTLLAQYVRPDDQPQAIKEFLQAVRSQPA